MSATYDMDPGDAIIWDRNLFHHGDPFNEVTGEMKMRYTIRYVPSLPIQLQLVSITLR
jgi:hypothetical protein